MDREITITVTDDEAREIDERVAAGEFASPQDIARAALQFFLHDPADIPRDVLRRLIEEDEADPSPDIDGEDAFAQVHRYIDQLASKRDANS